MSRGIDVEAVRAEIPATRRCIYMNTGTSGPCPRRTVEAVKQMHQWMNECGPSAPEVQAKVAEVEGTLRRRLAALLNCAPSQVVLTHNTSEGINIVLNGLRLGPDDEVIVTDLEHDSVLVPVYHLCAALGAKWRMLKLAGGADPVAELESAITAKTKMVVFSHIAFCNGQKLPVKEMAAVASFRGVPVLIDGAQAVGHIPVDVADLGVQFYALPGQKWLLGPDGTGALYIAEEWLHRLHPSWVGWASRVEYDLDGGYTLKDDARRFEVGTMDPAVLCGLSESLLYLAELGLDAVEARILHLSDMLREELSSLPGVKLHSPAGGFARCGLVAFTVDGVEPKQAVAALYQKARVVCRWIPPPFPPVVRFSVNFFQTEEEIEEACRCVASLAGGA